ncbi:MAG: O-methyltransferase [Deltaproteobacteria bacterium]|nr:MAG: O-methyltransferase [Deltaproteobacteria bacterium]
MSLPRNALRSPFDPEMRDYVQVLVDEQDALVDRMELYAKERDFPIIGRDAGRWLELLTKMIGAKRVLEIGAGFGYSAFFFARGVGPDGHVRGIERNDYEILGFEVLFAGHPLADRIAIEAGEGRDVLGEEAEWDVIFVDAEKEEYAELLALAVPRLRPGGLVLFDNALWGGRVVEDAADSATEGVQRFNEALFAHPELDAHILPAGDGLAVGRKRG